MNGACVELTTKTPVRFSGRGKKVNTSAYEVNWLGLALAGLHGHQKHCGRVLPNKPSGPIMVACAGLAARIRVGQARLAAQIAAGMGCGHREHGPLLGNGASKAVPGNHTASSAAILLSIQRAHKPVFLAGPVPFAFPTAPCHPQIHPIRSLATGSR